MLLNIHCLIRWHWNSETLCSLVFLCLIIPWAGDVLCMRARPYCMQYMEEEDEEFTRYRLCMYYRISSAQLNRELVCKETSKMWSLLGCEQFLTQYFLAGKAKNGGASRNERHKERGFLDILEPGCNKDWTRDSSLSLASQWYIEHGNHLHLIIITQWWQTFELASLSISWSSLQLRLIGLGSDHRFADGSSNSPTETEN